MFYKIQMVIVYCLSIGNMNTQLVIQETSDDPVSYTIEAPKIIKVGSEFVITTTFNIEDGWYVYAPIAMNEALGKIPTKVTFRAPEGFKKIGGLVLPDNNVFFDTYSGKGISMSQRFKVAKNIPLGKQTIAANIVYQTCNDVICYPPVRKKVDIVISIK